MAHIGGSIVRDAIIAPLLKALCEMGKSANVLGRLTRVPNEWFQVLFRRGGGTDRFEVGLACDSSDASVNAANIKKFKHVLGPTRNDLRERGDVVQ